MDSLTGLERQLLVLVEALNSAESELAETKLELDKAKRELALFDAALLKGSWRRIRTKGAEN